MLFIGKDMIMAKLSGDKVTSNSADAFSLYEKSRFGEKKESRVEYSLVETLFLVNDRKIKVFSGTKELDEEALIKKFKKVDKKIEVKSAVFSDLRRKGYIVKTALKFGAEFRVYNKGVKPGEDHAKWILYATNENEGLSWHDFAAKNRVAHSTQKNLLIGIVDEEGDVSYYEIAWTRP